MEVTYLRPPWLTASYHPRYAVAVSGPLDVVADHGSRPAIVVPPGPGRAVISTDSNDSKTTV
jgi:hypothetical protein